MSRLGIGIVLVLTLMAYDFVTRIKIAPHSSVQKDTVTESGTAYRSTRLTQAQRDDILAVFSGFDGQDKVSAPDQAVGMSAELQAKQKGDLDQLYAGDYILKLRAVIKEHDGEHQVLLEKKHVSQSLTETVSLSLKEQLLGYELSQIGQAFATMNSVDNAARKIHLQLRSKNNKGLQ